jgi:hypothetical protein
MTMCTLLVAMALAALLVWSPLFRQACVAAALLFAMLAFRARVRRVGAALSGGARPVPQLSPA